MIKTAYSLISLSIFCIVADMISASWCSSWGFIHKTYHYLGASSPTPTPFQKLNSKIYLLLRAVCIFLLLRLDLALHGVLVGIFSCSWALPYLQMISALKYNSRLRADILLFLLKDYEKYQD